MVIASGPGPLGENIPPGITLVSLRDSFFILLGCLALLLIALFLLGFVLRRQPGRFWRHKLVIFVAAMSLFALISADQAWPAYQSFVHYGLPPNAGYLDWYERFGQDVADQLGGAVGGFGTCSFHFSLATLAVLSVVGEQFVTSLRAKRRAIPRGIS